MKKLTKKAKRGLKNLIIIFIFAIGIDAVIFIYLMVNNYIIIK